MTANDHDARLARLCAATKGDTVTVPDGWEKPGTTGADTLAVQRADLRPGDVFKHDGTADNLRWSTSLVACTRKGNRFWYSSEHLAALGLDVDAPAGPRVTVSDAVPEGTAIAGDFSTDDGSGTVILDVVPDTDAFRDAVRKVSERPAATEERVDEPAVRDVEYHGCVRPDGRVFIAPEGTALPVDGPPGDGWKEVGYMDVDGLHEPDVSVPGEPRVWLDEFQQERVAALEHAIRLLESRRNSDEQAAKLFGVETARIVSVQDMIDVAAFIAMGDTGRIEDAEEGRA